MNSTRSADPRLRGERPENPMAYQQPTHAELYAEVRRLDSQLAGAVEALKTIAAMGEWGTAVSAEDTVQAAVQVARVAFGRFGGQ